MFEVRFLIPQRSMEGESFLPGHHAQFEAYLADEFNGFTRYGSAEGGWVSEGRVVRDDHAVYAVALGSILDAAKLGDLVQLVKNHYAQEAVYLTYLGQAEIL